MRDVRVSPIVPLLALTSVLLTGCSSAPLPSGSRTATYQSLDGLRSAFDAAGGTCSGKSEDDDIRAAAQSGVCSNGVTLSTYLSGADLLSEVQILRDTAASGDDGADPPPRTEVLLGANWLVSGARVRQLQSKLGGRLLVINPAAAN